MVKASKAGQVGEENERISITANPAYKTLQLAMDDLPHIVTSDKSGCQGGFGKAEHSPIHPPSAWPTESNTLRPVNTLGGRRMIQQGPT